MTVRESYEKMGANYDGVLSRLGNEMLIKKFSVKFLKDPSFQDLTDAIEQVRDAITTATGEAVHHPHISALPNLYVTDFIKDMANAYAAADLVISRAGAGSISEFCLLHKPVILVPSPNVAEDHQTKNALALVDKDAAIYVKDAEAKEKLLSVALETVKDNEKLKALSNNIAKLALPDSATVIAKEVLKLIK